MTPRSDARRNRHRVLTAAQAAFAEEGLLVSLAEIAQRAGVGAGTVHRHFPSKQDLVEAVVQARIEQLVIEVEDLVGREGPGTAFFTFFARMVGQIARNKALCDTFEADPGRKLRLVEGSQAFRNALGDLLHRAQDAGAVRADLDVADVFTLVAGCVAMERTEPGGPGAAAGRMTALVSDALRPVPTKNRPDADTKQRPGADDCNETESRSPDRNETLPDRGTRSCAMCGTSLRASPTGRRARYCGPACRQKAHRRRHRGGG